MLRRTLALAAFLILAVPAGAAAQEYPPERDESLTVSDASVAPGQSLRFEATGFAAGSSATMMLFSAPRDLGTYTADGEGVVRGDLTIPADTAPGRHTLELTGTAPGGAGRTVSAVITVLGDAASRGGDRETGGFASTGSSTMPLVSAGAILVVLGAAAVLVTRRRSVA